MTDMTEQQVAKGLAKIRLLRMSLLAIVITFPLTVYILTGLQVTEKIVILTGVTWVVIGIILEFVIGFSRCPACRKHFHVRGMTGNFFTRQCLNCGIPLKKPKE